MKHTLKHIIVHILTWQAKKALKRHNPRIIAVTGNVGKTSTKDAVYRVVSQAFSTRKSEKSMNSEIGLPLTILGLPNAWNSLQGWMRNIVRGFAVAYGWDGKVFPAWLVLEIGADHPGDIESVSTWLHPDVTVLTRMSEVPVHGEYFDGPEDVLREKMYLVKALKPTGTLVVNSDDPLFVNAIKESGFSGKILSYGTSKQSSVSLTKSEVMYGPEPLTLPVGQYALIRLPRTDADQTEKIVRIEIPGMLGNHGMYSIAAAATVAVELGITSQIAGAFTEFESPRGRMKILKGKATSALIDDTYNSSPLACIEALKTLSVLSIRGRKIAVLGDMKELGDGAKKAHIDIGELVADMAHTLVTVGPMAHYIAMGARDADMPGDRIVSFDTAEQAAVFLADMVRAGDCVLVKGSQSMRMERISKALLARPEEASAVLVRQEKEWEVR